MTRSQTGEARARAVVEKRMADRGINQAQLSRDTGLDPGTVSDFLAGTRWPRRPTLASIEKVLGMETGSLTDMAEDDVPQPGIERWPIRTEPPTREEAEMAVPVLRGQLHRGLQRFTDDELIAEIRTRTLLYAALLHAGGEKTLSWRVAADGGDSLASSPSDGE